MTGPTDERGRYDLCDRMAAEQVRLLAAVVGGPAGRLLRRQAGSDGRHLFGCVELKGKAVWLPVGPAHECQRALRELAPAGECRGCGGKGCEACHRAGYVPQVPAAVRLLPAPLALDPDHPAVREWLLARRQDHGVNVPRGLPPEREAAESGKVGQPTLFDDIHEGGE